MVEAAGSAVKESKMNCAKGVLPPWGDGPAPARPLSPKRARRPTSAVESTATAVASKCQARGTASEQGRTYPEKNAEVHRFLKQGAQARLPQPQQRHAVAFVVFCAVALLAKWRLDNTVSLDSADLSERLPPNSDLPVPSEHTNLAAEKYHSSIDIASADVFIVAEPFEPHQLENYSAVVATKHLLPPKDVFMQLDDTYFSELFGEPEVVPLVTHIEQLKLEEVGTSWSQPQLPIGAAPPTLSHTVSFRRHLESDYEQKRPLTYKLQWFVNERPLTNKLQWFASRDDLLLEPHAYELRWGN